MIGLWILGILLLLLLLLMLLRLGVEVSFGGQIYVLVCVGPVRMQVLPREKKTPAPKAATAKEVSAEASPAKEKKPGFVWADLKPEVPVLLEALKRALSRTRQRLLIRPMEVSVTIGGTDPAKVGETYGRANALVWQWMPQLERLVRMPQPYVHLECDFTGGPTRVEGQIGVSLRVWDLLVIGMTLAVPALGCLKRIKKRQAERLAQEKQKNSTTMADGTATTMRKDVTDGNESEK